MPRVEDGARCTQLDPDCESDGVIDKGQGVELVQTRTMEGYPTTLRADSVVDEIGVDNHILGATGSDYFLSGSQLAGGRKGRGHEGGRR